ncbi:MAG: EAL domain-containing protein [Methylobacter sp.]|nr:EAL domain-containing protein [Methylobacter sp.]
MTTNPSDKAIVAAIVVMAQQLKLEVVAESVTQLELLRELRCHYVQGYYSVNRCRRTRFCFFCSKGSFLQLKHDITFHT